MASPNSSATHQRLFLADLTVPESGHSKGTIDPKQKFGALQLGRVTVELSAARAELGTLSSTRAPGRIARRIELVCYREFRKAELGILF